MVAGRRTNIRLQSSHAALQTQPVPVASFRSLPPTSRRKRYDSQPIEHLNIALRIYHDDTSHRSEHISRASKLALWKDTRLSVVTAQMILYISPNLDPQILRRLRNNRDWDETLTKVQAQRFSTNEVFSWARILIAKTPNDRVREFISHPGPKPLFLLDYILHDKSFGGPQISSGSLNKLMEYCEKNVNDVFRTPLDTESGSDGRGVTELNPGPLQQVLEKFLCHARRIHLQLAVRVADLGVACLENLSFRAGNPSAVYRFKCSVFTSLLRQLAIPPNHSAYKHRLYNWQAMLKLLSLSSGLEKPLLIDRASYRAIRGTLVGVPKTESERDSATALSRTWPPHRILRNGMEEDTPLEEFASRSVKAGTMMMEAGYAKELMDLINDVLGGVNVDGTPTIQTRAIVPRQPTASATLFSLWASQVRATRNPEEAWQAFQRPPQPGMEANGAVFEEMIYKLLARPAVEYHNNLPGDGREIFPFDDLNYSDYEKARLTPPNLHRLISVMVSFGIPLMGKALRAVIRLAPSTREAALYIRQSALSLSQQMTLETILGMARDRDASFATRYRGVNPQPLRHMPERLIMAVIELLCRLHPNLTSKGLSVVRPQHLSRIHHAYHIAYTPAFRRNPRLWEIVLGALSRPNIVLTSRSIEQNRVQVLQFGGKLVAGARQSSTITLPMLQSFAAVIRKTMESLLPSLVESARHEGSSAALFTFAPTYHHPVATSMRLVSMDWTRLDPHESGLQRMLDGAQVTLKSMWLSLASPDGNPAACMVDGCSVNDYMKALAFLGDHREMEHLLEWTLDNMNTVTDRSDRKSLQYLQRSLCVFRAFAEPMLPIETIATLRRNFEDPRDRIRRGLTITWPSDEEVFQYAEHDPWGHRQQLSAVLRCVKELQAGDDEGGDGGARQMEEQNAPVKTWQPHKDLEKHLFSLKRELSERYGRAGLAMYRKARS